MKSVVKPVLVVIVFLILAALGYGLFHHYHICEQCLNIKNLNAEVIRHYIQGFGSWGIAVFVVLYTANTFSPFLPPIAFLSLAAGALFGPVWGTLALTLGTFCGTTAAFLAARYVLRSWVKKFIKGKSAELDEKLSNNGFFILLPMRLIGFPPYGIIDFICGLSRMKYLDFVAATMLGAVPWIIAQVLLADRIAIYSSQFRWNDVGTWFDPVLVTIIAVFVAMIVITGKIVKAKQKTQEG